MWESGRGQGRDAAVVNLRTLWPTTYAVRGSSWFASDLADTPIGTAGAHSAHSYHEATDSGDMTDDRGARDLGAERLSRKERRVGGAASQHKHTNTMPLPLSQPLVFPSTFLGLRV